MASAAARSAVHFFEERFARVGSPARAAGAKAYMKSALRFHGVDAATVRKAARDYRKLRPPTRDSLRRDVDALYATDGFELRWAALCLLELDATLLQQRDAAWIVDLCRRSGCWAHVDQVSVHVLGVLVARHPTLARSLRRWGKDRDFWVQRAALLSLLVPLARGGGDFALFCELAVPLLESREFLLRKAIGWILRAVSKKRPALVRDFLRRHGARCSGVTLREARKYLSSKNADRARRRRPA